MRDNKHEKRISIGDVCVQPQNRVYMCWYAFKQESYYIPTDYTFNISEIINHPENCVCEFYYGF